MAEKTLDERILHEWKGLVVLYADNEKDAREKAKRLTEAGICTVSYRAEMLSDGIYHGKVVKNTGTLRDFLEASGEAFDEQQIPSTLTAAITSPNAYGNVVALVWASEAQMQKFWSQPTSVTENARRAS